MPGFVNWPRHLTAGRIAAPVHIVDWMPTLCHLAGFELGQSLQWDGQNIWPVITGETTNPAERVLYWKTPSAAAVRKGEWKLIVSSRNDGTQFTTLYEFHNPLEVGYDKNFYVYYGVGGHLGFERFDDLNKVLVSTDPDEFVFEDKSYFTMGLDLIAGVEYRYLTVPMTIAFELKPYFTFVGMRYTKSTFWDAGFSIKYVF